MERQRIDRPDGSVALVVTGPGGAVSLEAWMYEGSPQGVIAIHYANSFLDDDVRASCDYIEGGCYTDQNWLHGQEPAEKLLAGDEAAGWAAVEQWYASRIEGRRQ